MLFEKSLENEEILKRFVKIKWQDGATTDSCFTYYRSKNELRITKFGRGFPFLTPEQTGALFVLTRQDTMDEMQEENIVLVVPKPFIHTYPPDRQERIWTIAKFIAYVKEIENI